MIKILIFYIRNITLRIGYILLPLKLQIITNKLISFIDIKVTSLIEIKNLIRYLKNNKDKRKFVFIYDFKCSPIAFAEFIVVCIFIKNIQFFKKNVFFLLVYDGLRKNFEINLEKNETIQNRVSHLKKILKYFFDRNYYFVSWEEYKNKQLSDNEFYTFMKYKVIKRKSIYKYCHLLNNYFDFYLKKKFLFNKKFFNKIKFKKKLPNNYISLPIRFKNKVNDKTTRNLNINEIEKLIVFLNNTFREKIIIHSDFFTYKVLKKKLKNKNIFFSKEFTSNFMDEGKIIIKSKFLFSYKATGPFVFAEYSKLKYFLILDDGELQVFNTKKDFLENDIFFNYSKKNNWQNKNQKIYKFIKIKELNKKMLN